MEAPNASRESPASFHDVMAQPPSTAIARARRVWRGAAGPRRAEGADRRLLRLHLGHPRAEAPVTDCAKVILGPSARIQLVSAGLRARARATARYSSTGPPPSTP